MSVINLIGKTTSYDEIVAHLRSSEGDESTLSPKQQELLNRWVGAYALMRNYNSVSEAVPLHRRAHEGLSRAAAYRDFECAVSLFGDCFAVKREGIKHLCSEIAQDAIKMARQQNKPAIMLQGVDTLAMLHGLNRDEPEPFDFSKLEKHQVIISLTSDAIEFIQAITGKGAINLDEMAKHHIEETEATVLDDTNAE